MIIKLISRFDVAAASTNVSYRAASRQPFLARRRFAFMQKVRLLATFFKAQHRTQKPAV